jgi:mannose-6-phosphate isomerase-like protein (cupin superfamily)
MTRAGDWYENVRTRELAQLLVAPEDTGGARLEAELYLQPGGAVVGEHVHDRLHERFTVVEGTLAVVLDGERSAAGPGAVVDVPPGRAHDWSNAGDGVARVHVEVEGPAPMALRFVELIEVMFGLANTGRTNAKGMPTPLWLAATAHEYRDVMYLTKPPRAVQRIVLGGIAALARRLGRDPTADWLHGDASPARAAGRIPLPPAGGR